MFQSLLEKFTRPFLSFKLAYERQKRTETEVSRYYHNSLFQALDLRLKSNYSDRSPFKISKDYQNLNPDDRNLYLYGETPLCVYESFSKRWGLCESDLFLELGSGIGRGIFFLASFFHCKCVGVEWVPEYSERAKKIAQFNRLQDVYFVCSDLFKMEFPKANFIYLFGSCLKTHEIYELCEKLKRQSKNVKIITVSFPLSFYDKDFTTVDEFTAPYEFGKTSVYLNKISKD